MIAAHGVEQGSAAVLQGKGRGCVIAGLAWGCARAAPASPGAAGPQPAGIPFPPSPSSRLGVFSQSSTAQVSFSVCNTIIFKLCNFKDNLKF